MLGAWDDGDIPRPETDSSQPLANVAAKRFGEAEATRYGKLAAAGKPIGQFDTLIAAHALTLSLTLVTSNTKHFAVVPGLTVRGWV